MQFGPFSRGGRLLAAISGTATLLLSFSAQTISIRRNKQTEKLTESYKRLGKTALDDIYIRQQTKGGTQAKEFRHSLKSLANDKITLDLIDLFGPIPLLTGGEQDDRWAITLRRKDPRTGRLALLYSNIPNPGASIYFEHHSHKQRLNLFNDKDAATFTETYGQLAEVLDDETVWQALERTVKLNLPAASSDGSDKVVESTPRDPFTKKNPLSSLWNVATSTVAAIDEAYQKIERNLPHEKMAKYGKAIPRLVVNDTSPRVLLFSPARDTNYQAGLRARDDSHGYDLTTTEGRVQFAQRYPKLFLRLPQEIDTAFDRAYEDHPTLLPEELLALSKSEQASSAVEKNEAARISQGIMNGVLTNEKVRSLFEEFQNLEGGDEPFPLVSENDRGQETTLQIKNGSGENPVLVLGRNDHQIPITDKNVLGAVKKFPRLMGLVTSEGISSALGARLSVPTWTATGGKEKDRAREQRFHEGLPFFRQVESLIEQYGLDHTLHVSFQSSEETPRPDFSVTVSPSTYEATSETTRSDLTLELQVYPYYANAHAPRLTRNNIQAFFRDHGPEANRLKSEIASHFEEAMVSTLTWRKQQLVEGLELHGDQSEIGPVPAKGDSPAQFAAYGKKLTEVEKSVVRRIEEATDKTRNAMLLLEHPAITTILGKVNASILIRDNGKQHIELASHKDGPMLRISIPGKYPVELIAGQVPRDLRDKVITYGGVDPVWIESALEKAEKEARQLTPAAKLLRDDPRKYE